MTSPADSARLRQRADGPRLVVGPTDFTPEALPAVSPMRKRSWRGIGWLAALVVLVAVAGAAWAVGSSSQSPDQAAARAIEPAPSWITAPVEFRVLSSTLVTRGDVEAETSTKIKAPSSVEGDAVITRSVVDVGDVVSEGGRVVEVSGRPVFVVQSSAAIYRTLRPGMEGDDVIGWQTSLDRLGYAVETNGQFDEATKAATIAFYGDAGYEPVPTSTAYPADFAAAERSLSDAKNDAASARHNLDNAVDGPARSEISDADAAVAAALNVLEDARATRVEQTDVWEGAVRNAQASRTEIHARSEISVDEYNAANTAVHGAEIELANTVRDADATVEAAEDQLEVAVLRRDELNAAVDTTALQVAVESAQAAVVDSQMALAELQRVNGPTVPQGEVVFVTSTPTRVLSKSDDDRSDDPAPSEGTTFISLASGPLVVAGSVRPDQVSIVSVGLEVELLHELTGDTYLAVVAVVADEPSADAMGRLTHEILLAPAEQLPDDLVGTNIRVTLTAASTESEQLVVPVAAVTSAADGTTWVRVVDSAGTPREVEVLAGLSADGFVVVRPVDQSTLDANQAVIVGR